MSLFVSARPGSGCHSVWDVCNECVGYERRALRHDEGERPQHGGRVGRRHCDPHCGKRQTHKVTVLMSLGIKAGIILLYDTLNTFLFIIMRCQTYKVKDYSDIKR